MLTAPVGVSEALAELADGGDRCRHSLEGETGVPDWGTSLGRGVDEALVVSSLFTASSTSKLTAVNITFFCKASEIDFEES